MQMMAAKRARPADNGPKLSRQERLQQNQDAKDAVRSQMNLQVLQQVNETLRRCDAKVTLM